MCVCVLLAHSPTGSRDEGGCRVARPVRPHPCAVMSGLINGSMVCYRRTGLGGAVSGTIGPRSFGCLACNFECNAGPVRTWVKWLRRNPLAAGSTASVGEQICSTTMQLQADSVLVRSRVDRYMVYRFQTSHRLLRREEKGETLASPRHDLIPPSQGAASRQAPKRTDDICAT